MNFSLAKDILELPDNFTPETIKQNYRRLSLKHHPDKGGNNSDFVKITEAYRFLTTENESPPHLNLNEIFKNLFNTSGIFKSTNNFKTTGAGMQSFFGFKREINLTLSPREFLEGTTREVETTFKTQCTCEQTFCHKCRGFSFNGCNECFGSGIIQQCESCTNGFLTHKKIVKVIIPKTSLNTINVNDTVINLKLDNPKYTVNDNKLYYRYNITLKESLTGFIKIFKDPFEIEHTVKSNTIVKQNDGYFISDSFYLLFNIIFPKQLLTQLKSIDF
jgi:DnaJ-class molecular chaperone